MAPGKGGRVGQGRGEGDGKDGSGGGFTGGVIIKGIQGPQSSCLFFCHDFKGKSKLVWWALPANRGLRDIWPFHSCRKITAAIHLESMQIKVV